MRWEIRGWGDLMRGLAFWYGFFLSGFLGGVVWFEGGEDDGKYREGI